MEEINKTIDYIKTTRDELNLRSHLLEAELQERWNELENKWEYFYENELKPPLETIKDVSENITAANKLVLEEIVEGYEKIKTSLK